MRRKVRGTVSGIYMCSAALGECFKRCHGSKLLAVLQQNGFSRCFFLLQITPQIAYFTPLAHLCERFSAEGSLLISRDSDNESMGA